MKEYFLGIDTSNYTTSAALCDGNGKIVAGVKKLLPVAQGQKGLRQSDALFHHTVQLPHVLRQLSPFLQDGKLLAVGASCRPRDAEGSYMPCFLAGKSSAVSASVSASCPFYEFSHQCGHVAAAVYSAGKNKLFSESFAAFHVSGGTTDVLLVSPDRERIFKVKRIGGTLDLNAGQLIDRAGVMMGLGFPCGPELERLALSYKGEGHKVSVSVKNLDCNLSGIENKASKLYSETWDSAACASFVIRSVSETLKRISENLTEQYKGIPVVYAGGVMSCSIIKNELSPFGAFADPEFSSDNAAGVSLMTYMKYYGLQ